MRFSLRVLGNMAGIWVSTQVVAGVTLEHSGSAGRTLLNLFLFALVLAVVNSLVRPLVKVLAFPLYILTLGLFVLVTNGLMFSLAVWLVQKASLPVLVTQWSSAVWAGTVTAIVAAFVAWVLGALLPSKPSDR